MATQRDRWSCTLEDVVFKVHVPFWEFYYRLQQLTEAQNEPESSDHIKLLLDTLNSHLKDTHGIARDLAENKVITYDYLCAIIPRKAVVYHQLFGRVCLMEVTKTDHYKQLDREIDRIHCWYVELDDEKFGWKAITIEIPHFVGTKPILDLEAYPAEYHKSLQHLQSTLLQRGRKFISLSGRHHKAYQGEIMVSGEPLLGLQELSQAIVRVSHTE